MAEAHVRSNLSSSSSDSSSSRSPNDTLTASQIDDAALNSLAPAQPVLRPMPLYHEGEAILPHGDSALQESMTDALNNQVIVNTNDDADQDIADAPDRKSTKRPHSPDVVEENGASPRDIGNVSEDSDAELKDNDKTKDRNKTDSSHDSIEDLDRWGLFDPFDCEPAVNQSLGNRNTQGPPPQPPPPQNRNQQRRKISHNRSNLPRQPDPTFLLFPVVLHDLGTGTSTFSSHVPYTNNTIFRNTNVGPIKSQRPLPSGKWLIGCYNVEQQKRLAQKTELCGIRVTCAIPSNHVDGVIKPVSTSIDVNTIVNDVHNVTSARRLKTKDAADSKAVRVTFNAAVLPKEIHLGPQTYVVEPYCPPVLRCTKCNRLGHTKTKCRSNYRTCPACGVRDPEHTPRECPNPKKCTNCQGPHSAAYAGCPEIRTRQEAGRIRSAAYIPYSEALTRARKATTVPKPKPPPQPVVADAYYRQEYPPVNQTQRRRRTSTPSSSDSPADPPPLDVSQIRQKTQQRRRRPKRAKQLTYAQQARLNVQTTRTQTNLEPYPKDTYDNPPKQTEQTEETQVKQVDINQPSGSKAHATPMKKRRTMIPRNLRIDLTQNDTLNSTANSDRSEQNRKFHDQAQQVKKTQVDNLEDRLYNKLVKRLEETDHLHKRWEDERQQAYDEAYSILKSAPRLNETYNQAYDFLLALAQPKNLRDDSAHNEVLEYIFRLIGTQDNIPVPTDDPNIKGLMALVTGENPTVVINHLKTTN